MPGSWVRVPPLLSASQSLTRGWLESFWAALPRTLALAMTASRVAALMSGLKPRIRIGETRGLWRIQRATTSIQHAPRPWTRGEIHDGARGSTPMIAGRWGKPSEVLLDLVVEGDGSVRGVANPGRQNAPIRRGHFDADSGAVNLEGEHVKPDGTTTPFCIAGRLDGRTLRLTYQLATCEVRPTWYESRNTRRRRSR